MQGGKIMSVWIEDKDLDLLDRVFEEDNLIPRNKKGSYKLRHLSLYNSNTKAITNLCKNLEEVSLKNSVAHQYTEILRKCGLITTDFELTKYGKMLLQILHYDNNRIINEINRSKSVKDLSEDIPYTIEFFLFCVINKLLDDKVECQNSGIVQGDLFNEPINNIEYFFTNIIDTMKEPTNKDNRKDDLHGFFNFENDEFYYTLQAMNFTGYEVKRLFRMNEKKIEETWRIYYKILESLNQMNAATYNALTDRELKYYNYANYFNGQVQKDVRNRVKLSLFSYILLNSIKVNRNKIKIIKKHDYEYLISYDEIHDIVNKFNLLDVYRLVFLERDSKYISNEIKALAIGANNFNLDGTDSVSISDQSRKEQIINIGDKVIFVNTSKDKILDSHVYLIDEITSIGGSQLEMKVSRKNKLNMSMEEEIIADFKE